MMNLGFNFAGTEELFAEILEQSIRERTTVNFQFLEIGTATGRTLVSVADYLRDKLATWRATSIDLVDGPFFDAKEFLKMSLAHQVGIEFCGNGHREPFVSNEAKNDIRVLLLKSPDKRAICAPDSVNFVLIDGCHGAPCVEADFLSVERSVCDGGIVAFHDAGIQDQGFGPQKHCGGYINIHEALVKLNLCHFVQIKHGELGLQKELYYGSRPNWKLIAKAEGDKSTGSLEQNGNGIAFFQKQTVKKNAYQEGFSGERL